MDGDLRLRHRGARAQGCEARAAQQREELVRRVDARGRRRRAVRSAPRPTRPRLARRPRARRGAAKESRSVVSSPAASARRRPRSSSIRRTAVPLFEPTGGSTSSTLRPYRATRPSSRAVSAIASSSRIAACLVVAVAEMECHGEPFHLDLVRRPGALAAKAASVRRQRSARGSSSSPCEPTQTTPSTPTRARTSSPARPLTTATSAYRPRGARARPASPAAATASSGRSTIGARTPSKSRNSPVSSGAAASCRRSSSTRANATSPGGHNPAVPELDELWIPLVDEPIGGSSSASCATTRARGAGRDAAPHPRLQDVRLHPHRDPARAAPLRPRHPRLGRLGELGRRAAARPRPPRRDRAEVRAVAEEIAADPQYADDEPIAPDEGARDRFRAFAREHLGRSG